MPRPRLCAPVQKRRGADPVTRLSFRLDQPRHRARHHPLTADGLAVHRGRMDRRCGAHRHHERAGASHLSRKAGAGSAPPSRTFRRARSRKYNACRRDALAETQGSTRAHRHRPEFRDGLGNAVEGPRRRISHRRRAVGFRVRRVLGSAVPQGLFAVAAGAGQHARGPTHRGHLVRLLDRQRADGGRAVGLGHQLRRGSGVPLRRPYRHPAARRVPRYYGWRMAA